jgi:dual specificity phosphatase 3
LDQLYLADLDWLTTTVAVGGDLHPHPSVAARQVRWLVAQGVTDVVDCRLEHSDQELVERTAPHLRYHWLPVDDHGGRLPARWWIEGTDLADRALDAGGRVFIHCHMGVNRAPSLAVAVLVHRSWRPLDAWRLLRARRPQAHALYAPQYLESLGRLDEAGALRRAMDADCDHGERAAAVGRIRRAERSAGYRFPLAARTSAPLVGPTAGLGASPGG